MTLNISEQVLKELTGSLTYHGSSRNQLRTAQKGIDLIVSLQSTDGPEKWIEYSGHLMMALYHAPPFGNEGKRATPQVIIDPRHPFGFEIKYLLPNDCRPWEHTLGYANDITDATKMIIDALRCCEQRDRHLYESERERE